MKKQIMLIAFVAISISAFSQNMIRGEYYIDSDPGFGHATGFSITVPDSDLTQAITIPYASFNGSGYHNLFVRTQDSNGNWSQTSRSFVQADDNFNLSEVIKVEYFFDVDNGFGNNSFELLEASSDNTWNFIIPFDQLPKDWKANDSLSIRVQESVINNWSQTTLIDSLNFVMVGIEDIEELTGVSVFPNPFIDEISISSKNDDNLRMLLYNNAGILLLDKKVSNNDKINTLALASGVYIIVIYANNQKLFGAKIVKL
jgi:hypothetical protein